MAAVGDRVKKGQPIVKLDDDEPQADVRSRKALLEGARATLKEARRLAARAEKSYLQGGVPEATYFAMQTAALKAEHDERAAVAALESSQAELEHYTVVAPIDGIISRLDVHIGTVARPGTTVWGEILDLSELDARCSLTPEQADLLRVGSPAEVLCGSARVACQVINIGIAADPTTGLVPALVRFPNDKCTLRCGVPVRIRFPATRPALGGH
jgi:RND family efflux transporter MFP subunit